MLSLSKLSSKYGSYKRVTSNEYEVRFNCPYCVKHGKTPDRKYHLYISLVKEVGYCFRCGQVLTKSDLNSYLSAIPVYNHDSSLPVEGRKFYIEDLKLVSVFEFPSALKFLRYRYESLYGFKHLCDFIERYSIQVNVDDRYPFIYQRLAIPIYWNNEVVGYQFRSLYGEEPKYVTLGVGNFSPKSIVFNYDRAKFSDRVYVCEGVFDLLPFEEDEAVAVFGKKVTRSVLNLLVSTWSEIIICLDGDAYQESKELARMLYLSGVENVKIKKLPKDKDPAEVGFVVKDLPEETISIKEILGYEDQATISASFRI